MKKLKLALLSGGISSEREVSLNSGKQVFEALDKEKYAITHYDPKTDLEKLRNEVPRFNYSMRKHRVEDRDEGVDWLISTVDVS